MPTVAINAPKTPVTKGSNGIAMATLPNICKMPGPPAPFVPVPLPNIGMSGNGPQGYSTSVQIEGNPVAIQGSSFLSRGDIAAQGSGGGIVSMNVQGPTTFIGPGSFDVRIESKNVQLLGDPMLNNCGPPGAPANSATMAGVVQAPLAIKAALAGISAEMQHICDVICECKAERGGQNCVSKKLASEQEFSNIKPEVPFNMNPGEGLSPSPYMSQNEPWRATTRWAIRGSRRPDVIIPNDTSAPWRGDNIKAVIEIKLGADKWGVGQYRAYEKIASGGPLIEVTDGPEGCQCPDNDNHEPHPYPYPVTEEEREKERKKQREEEPEGEPFFPPGTGEVVATLALLAGMVALGAAAVATAPAWVPAAAAVAIVGGLAGLAGSSSPTPAGDGA